MGTVPMEVISLDEQRGRVRPRDEEGGIPVAVDLACLTPEQRLLWDENFQRLDEWTEGTICQATMLELWNFGQICVLDGGGVPSWPPELARELAHYGGMVQEYMANVRAARSRRAAREPTEGSEATERRFTYLLDRDGALLRWDKSLVSDVWWPPRNGKPGRWHRYQVDPFVANVTEITPAEAQELAGPDADLYAPVDESLVRSVAPGEPSEAD